MPLKNKSVPFFLKTTRIASTSLEAVDYFGVLGAAARKLPYCLRILAENVLRQANGEDAVYRVAEREGAEVPFRPSRLILQDMLGLPLLVDLMAMRSKVAAVGGDPSRIDMSLPVDLVVDHSMTIEYWAEELALEKNQNREFEVNRERFAFIKACESRFLNLRVIPPGGGIMHQLNLEYLATVVGADKPGSRLLVPDTNLGTDSHTPMVNALAVLGWGIGGLEAEAIMFGEVAPVNVPRVVGLEVIGHAPSNVTATDIALTVAEKLRAFGVVDCFVELFGPGYHTLSVADRGTIANMAPEYGATCVFCPLDSDTTDYLTTTGRPHDHVRLVELYCREQGLWVDAPDYRIEYDDVVRLDLRDIRRSVSGPSRPEQRIDLGDAPRALNLGHETEVSRRVQIGACGHDVGDGDVVIAAITSCTNTANPRNMVLAGLMARNAVAKGLSVKPHVKTSLAPGSRVVAQYLRDSGLQEPLSALGFEIAAFSCSTCNGMSGPLAPEYEAAIKEHDIKAVAVLSGNRNFAGRIHPLATGNVLASPPLVVAYALAGTILTDLTSEPLGVDENGQPVMLSELWPSADEVDAIVEANLSPNNFRDNYQMIAHVNQHWNELDVGPQTYDWLPSSYVTFPPFVEALEVGVSKLSPLTGLRPLALLGDSITTDHISPSGAITPDTDAGRFLIKHGVEPLDFNSFGTRRGSSDIVVRSTFANRRLRNEMTPDHEGPWTRLEPDGKVVSMFDAIAAYRDRGQQLVVIAGKEYGCGSSRDTAAKAPWLAGVRALIAESFERIHRSNLVNMGIAPLCFPKDVTRCSLALDGSETFDIVLADDLSAATLTVHRRDGSETTLPLDLRLYNESERETFRHGGLLPQMFRHFVSATA